jgi:hypothetical protein
MDPEAQRMGRMDAASSHPCVYGGARTTPIPTVCLTAGQSNPLWEE